MFDSAPEEALPRLVVGERRRFDYPKAFVTLPEYSARRGAVVTVVRVMRWPEEYENLGDPMYEIRADDGWIGHAFESELLPA